MKWKNLFDYLEEKVNFRYAEGKPEKDENITWTCGHTLTFTEEFCRTHGLDFGKVQAQLNATGGYCDCEVLWNSKDRIVGDNEILEAN